MRTKNRNPVELLKGDINPLIRLYFQVNHLKQLYRQGWLKQGREIPEAQCESVAEHICGMAILALFVCDKHFPELDRNKVITMVLVHELGEIADGDKYVTDATEKEERRAAERTAIIELLSELPDSPYLELWEEFELGESDEAKLVRELDKLEMVMQATIYSHQHGKDLNEFFVSSDSLITSEALREIFEAMRAL